MSANISKTKVMLLKLKIRINRTLRTIMSHFKPRKRAYYAFDEISNGGEIKNWVLKKYLFNTLVPLVLRGVVVGCGNMCESTKKEFEIFQNIGLSTIMQLVVYWVEIKCVDLARYRCT